MAVAADSHRNSLTTERTARRTPRREQAFPARGSAFILL